MTDQSRMADGLSNLVTGMGGGGDKSTYNFWAGPAGPTQGGGFLSRISDAEIDAAYESSWMVRKAHDIPPADMTRGWRLWEGDAKAIDLICAEEKRLALRDKVRAALSAARQRGGAALVFGLPGLSDQQPEATIPKGGFTYVHVATKDMLQIEEFDRDLTSPTFGQPKLYTVQGANGTTAKIHPSRVHVFKGLPVPLGGSYSDAIRQFWGAPLLESINRSMQNATLAQDGVASLLHEMKTDYISIPGLMEILSDAEDEENLKKRLAISQLMKSSYNVTLLDGGEVSATGQPAGAEKWEQRQVSFAQLPEIVMTFALLASGAVDIPATRFLGTPPKGMNATGEHDEANYNTMLEAAQESDIRPALDKIDGWLAQSAGVTKPNWTFAPLKTLTPKEQAELDNLVADTFDIVAATGLVQPDALAKVMVEVLDSGGSYPGLSEAVDKSTQDIPALKPAPDAAAIQPADPLVPGRPKLAKPAKPLQRAANDGAARLLDATPRPLYVSRKVMNPQELLNWARAQGIDNLVAAGDLHVTITYSREAVDWMDMPADWSSAEDGRLRIPAGGPRVLELMGPEKDVLAIQFSSDTLTYRHDAMVARGASWDWPTYQPQITVAYPMHPETDLGSLKPYTGRIILGPEVFADVNEDWRSGG